MKKQFLTAILCLFSLFVSSCAVSAYTDPQDGIYVGTEYRTRSYVDFDVIVRYGTPYYLNGALQYYTYNGLYYCPFYHDNYWYVRVYQRPPVHTHFVPNRYDYRFKPGHYPGFSRPKVTPPPPKRATPQGPRQNRPASPGKQPRRNSGRR